MGAPMTEIRCPMSPRPDPRPSLSRWTWTAIACASLVACGSPTPYQRPEVGLPASWPAAGAIRAPEPVAWTQLYTDERLQALIRAALERNHDLRLALARMEEARALWGVQRADQLPNVSLGTSHTGARTPPMVQGNAGAINTRRYDVGLNLLAFELDVWGRVASLSEAARLNFEASAEDRRTIRLGLISDVANAYYAQLEAQQRLGLLTQSEQSREQVLSLTQRKREVGAASDLDVALAQGAWLNTRAETVAMRRQAEQAGTALALLVGGQLPGTLPAGLPLGLQSMNLRWDRNLPSDVLLQRPDVRAAEARLMAAHANIQAARVAFLPRLQLTGLLGSASPAFNNLMGGGSSAWSFVPSLQLPIFDGGRLDAGVDLAQARKNQWVVGYEKTLQQAFREVADLLVARDTLREQVQAQQAALESQRERLRLTELRHRNGAASLIEWLDAQRDALAAEQGVAQTQRQWLSASALLFKALGGGDS
jgi:multidrug efflux system outer membrane protein